MLEKIEELWKECYGENLWEDYPGFYEELDKICMENESNISYLNNKITELTELTK